MKRATRDALYGLWREAMDAGNVWMLGVVEGARAFGLLTDDEADLWLRRAGECPEDGEHAGRTWCAYCGDLAERGTLVEVQVPDADAERCACGAPVLVSDLTRPGDPAWDGCCSVACQARQAVA